jgi:branched-chain amino acid aminotransferase
MIGPAFQTFDAQKLEIQLNKEIKPLMPENELVFGKHFTDHMVTIEWDAENGWGNPLIKPYGKLELEPSAVVLHYGFEVNLNCISRSWLLTNMRLVL